MSFLLSPWTTPKLQLTALQEIIGIVECVAIFILVVFLYALISEFRRKL